MRANLLRPLHRRPAQYPVAVRPLYNLASPMSSDRRARWLREVRSEVVVRRVAVHQAVVRQLLLHRVDPQDPTILHLSRRQPAQSPLVQASSRSDFSIYV